MRAVGHVLWSYVLPIVGLVAIVGVSAAVVHLLYLRGAFGRPGYLPDPALNEIVLRVPSLDGQFDLVLLKEETGFVMATVVEAGREVDHRRATRGPQFWLADENEQLPVEFSWTTSDLIRLHYCGIDVSGGNVIVAGDRTFDVEMVRQRDCAVTARGVLAA